MKELVRRLKKGERFSYPAGRVNGKNKLKRKLRGSGRNYLPWTAATLLGIRDGRKVAKRVTKKAGQPYRKKPKFHARRRAAGKNNVRPSRGRRK